MKKITVLNFCSQIGAASDEIPVVVKAGMQEIGPQFIQDSGASNAWGAGC